MRSAGIHNRRGISVMDYSRVCSVRIYYYGCLSVSDHGGMTTVRTYHHTCISMAVHRGMGTVGIHDDPCISMIENRGMGPVGIHDNGRVSMLVYRRMAAIRIDNDRLCPRREMHSYNKRKNTKKTFHDTMIECFNPYGKLFRPTETIGPFFIRAGMTGAFCDPKWQPGAPAGYLLLIYGYQDQI